MPPRSVLTERERFWSHVDRSSGPDACWPWMLSFRCNGREGQFRLDRHGRVVTAYRYAFETEVRPLAEGEQACHRCDNPPCCNPAHLFAGTQSDNMRDKTAKGRALRGEAIPQAKLSAANVVQVRREAAAGRSQRAIAADFGVAQTTISRAIRGACWGHIPARDT